MNGIVPPTRSRNRFVRGTRFPPPVEIHGRKAALLDLESTGGSSNRLCLPVLGPFLLVDLSGEAKSLLHSP